MQSRIKRTARQNLRLPGARRNRTDEQHMKIELLYFEACPNHEPAMNILREALESSGLQGRIEEVQVRTQSEAEAMGFVGSPSIRINGSDIEPWARTATVF